MNLGAVMIRPKKRIRVELYLRTKHAKTFFHLLREQKDDIEQEFGSSLEWEELPHGQNSRIAIYRDGTDPEDREDWTDQHEWLAKSINGLHRAFAGRDKSLDPGDWNSNAASDASV